MKKGDRLEVFVGGVVVGYAEVETIGEETVTVFIPAQRFVGKKRVTVDLTPDPVEGASTVLLTDGVETPNTVQGPLKADELTVEQTPVETTPEPQSPAVDGVAVPPEAPPAATVDEVSGSE